MPEELCLRARLALCWTRTGEHQLRPCYKLFAFLVTAVLGCSAADSESFGKVSWIPQAIASGSPCLFQLRTQTTPLTVTGTWQQHSLTFVSSDDHHLWYA